MQKEKDDQLYFCDISYDAETNRYEMTCGPIKEKESKVSNWLKKIKNWWKKVETKFKEKYHGDNSTPSGATGAAVQPPITPENVVNPNQQVPDTGSDIPASNGSTTAPVVNQEEPTPLKKLLDEGIEEYRDLDCSLFHCPGMFPTYEQVVACGVLLPLFTTDVFMDWDISRVPEELLIPDPLEEVKVVQAWFRDNKALLFKDWGIHNHPGYDSRWYENDDLRKSELTYNAKLPGNKVIVMVVATLQPSGLNEVSRVIARSTVRSW